MNENDISITKSCGNIFIDLGFPSPEATVMHMRVEIMVRISKWIKKNGWATADTARHLGITQLDASQLIREKIDIFSLDKLLIFAVRAGLHVDLAWKETDYSE